MSGGQRRRGAVLLEVLVAATIFAIASTVVLTRAAEARHAVLLARMAEQRVAAASRFLDRVALWPRSDLDRHLGIHPQGSWLLEVEHTAPGLYVVVLRDRSSGRKLITTALYRGGAGSRE